MDLSIFDLPDPSGKYSKESYLIKAYNEQYNYIIQYCFNYNLTDIPFKEKVFLCKNNLIKIPICLNEKCEKTTKFINSTLGYKSYCSLKCASSCSITLGKKENTSLERYGVKIPQKLEIIKEKIKKTNQDKYGQNSAMCLKITQEKSKKTLMGNHKVDNPSKSLDLIKKRIESFKKSNYKENYKKTSLEKYGVEHPWKSQEIHKKTIETSREIKNLITKNKILKKLENYQNYHLIEIDYESDIKKSIIKCDKGHEFEIARSMLYERSITKAEVCTICNPISKAISGQETLLIKFIKSNYSDKVLTNSRKIIKPYEIDIFLPNEKIGIEYNGIYWHSSANKPKNYHYNKFLLANKCGINLISIWEDDWLYKTDICKSLILNKIGKTNNKIYARKCLIKEITSSESNSFFNENHLQGACKSLIKIGLFYDNVLVSAATFSKMRIFMNKKNKDSNTYELVRFCNKINHYVVGGASKLFNFFIKKYKPNIVETFSDNMISNGNLYEKLGFKLLYTTNPGYYYSINGERANRFSYRKDVLVKQGYDKNKTEEEIMLERGYYRVYNAGNKKWIWYNNI